LNADDSDILKLKQEPNEYNMLKYNLYAYANNNPVNLTDPDGKNPVLIYYIGNAIAIYEPRVISWGSRFQPKGTFSALLGWYKDIRKRTL